MTIDEAIKHCLEVAEVNEDIADNCDMDNWMNKASCEECAADHRQLAEWLTELKEAKRLLKAAVEDIRYLINHAKRNGKACDRCKYGNEMYCYADDCNNDAKWQHEAEALALIGEDIDVPASADDTNVGRKSGGWISCKDRLPEPNTMVIVASYGSDIVIPEDGETVEECCERLKKERVRITLGFIGSDGWYGSDYFPLIVTPSFWQPLPGPPKGGDTE